MCFVKILQSFVHVSPTSVSEITALEIKTLNTVKLDQYSTKPCRAEAHSFLGFLCNNANFPRQATQFYVASYTTSKTEMPTLILTCVICNPTCNIPMDIFR